MKNTLEGIYRGSKGIAKTGNIEEYFTYVDKTHLKTASKSSKDYLLIGTGNFSVLIFETPHGVSYPHTGLDLIGKTGDYNFYMAPYGPGYYQAPFGELPSMAIHVENIPFVKKNKYQLSRSEHLKLFGIRMTPYRRGPFLPCSKRPPAFIHEGNSDCPILMSNHSKYKTYGIQPVAGTLIAGIGGNIYNHNPIPCSYDRHLMFLETGPYERSLITVPPPPGGGPSQEICLDTCTPSYSVGAGSTSLHLGFQNSYNASADRGPGVGVTQVHDTASVGWSNQRDANGNISTNPQVSAGDMSNFGLGDYWHFIFENNHKTLPFGNTTENVDMIKQNGAIEERHWWENREGKENIDYLNHAFGNNINACPMNYLDVPYYATIGKFGYFGTRFQDTWSVQVGKSGIDCVDISGVGIDDDGNQVPIQELNQDGSKKQKQSDQTDNSTATRKITYDNLLLNAANEREFNDWLAFGTTIFLELNYNFAISSAEYISLTSKITNFTGLFYNLCLTGHNIRSEREIINNFISNYVDPAGGTSPKEFDALISKFGSYKIKNLAGAIDEVFYNELVNKKKEKFSKRYYESIVSGEPVDLFPNNEITFSSEKASGFASSTYIKFHPSPDMANSTQAQLEYGSQRLSNYEYWNYPGGGTVNDLNVPSVPRRYFNTTFTSPFILDGYEKNIGSKYDVKSHTLNAYVLGSAAKHSQLTPHIGNNFASGINNFYIGYLRDRKCGAEDHVSASKVQLTLINLPNVGIWKNHAPERAPTPASNINSPIRSGWPGLGYNGIGSYDRRYSCFSPIFLQQPLNESVKVCQPPRFRIYAVDYHTISEDKIKENKPGGANTLPEIAYWLKKLKAIDSNGQNLYPLTYQWFRIHKSLASGYYLTKTIPEKDAAGNPIPLSYFQPASVSGEWCCAEGENTRDCTAIIPVQCANMYGVYFNGKNIDAPALARSSQLFWPAKSRTDLDGQYIIPDATRMMGATYAPKFFKDFYYFCRVEGRFGWRDSEFAKVNIETKTKFEFSVMDAFGIGGGGSFNVESHYNGTVAQIPVPMAGGTVQDSTVSALQTIKETWIPSRNCSYYNFVGNHGLRGFLRVKSPATYLDIGGKIIMNERWTDFGELKSVLVDLVLKGDGPSELAVALYADRALPNVARNGSNIYRYKGVTIRANGFVHRTALKAAGLKLYNTMGRYHGLKPRQISSVAGLYGSQSNWGDYSWDILSPGKEFYVYPNYSHGHYQFDVNLGALKGYSTTDFQYNRGVEFGFSRVQFIPSLMGRHGSRDSNITIAMDNFKTFSNNQINYIKLDNLSGPENGYNPAGLGRLMLYYVETYQTFYDKCEAKKTLKNDGFICGGLRQGRAGINVNWLGKPNDTRLRRISMPGPYAFQWKVERHNRDRNGNGMPLGFWSYEHEKRMDNLYDAAAVYGAVKRITYPKVSHPSIPPGVLGMRIAKDSDDTYDSWRFSNRSCGGAARWTRLTLNEQQQAVFTWPGYDSPTQIALNDMMRNLDKVGPDPESWYGCNSVTDKNCFYPCISLKYPDGFHPKGGKNNLGYNNLTNTTILNNPNTPITSAAEFENPTGPILGNVITMQNGTTISSVNLSACSTNRRDICNYLTPTVHMGVDSWPVGVVSQLSSFVRRY